MAKRTQTEAAPADWRPTQAVSDPILNSPYVEPREYWLYKGGVPQRVPGRRPASYHFKSSRTGAAEAEMSLFAEETSDDLPLVNALRDDVKQWRESGYRGATPVTKELLAWWLRADRPRRLFFCQQEAVETVIYLLEFAFPDRLRSTGFQKFGVDSENFKLLFRGEKPDFESIAGDFFPRLIDPASDDGLLPLRRMACKMATGSGKTIVMAMLVSWAFCNRGRNPASTQYPNAVLVCAPNLTVRKRLQVLCPDDPQNYYDAFDLVPPKYRECMNAGKVLVTNWHAFAPRSEHSEDGKSYAVVNKGEETNDAFTKNRLGELAQRLPILVLNDEGHHCWRDRKLSVAEERERMEGLIAEQKAALKEEENEARVWLAGLDRINNSALAGIENGKPEPGIITCVDLSATPFYLGNSGYPEGSPFTWIVSDFGLVDAIESGITKVPRLPVKDDLGNKDEAGRPDPMYFRLWENIKKQLGNADFIRKSQPKPEAVYKYAEGALQTLAGQWRKQFEEHQKASSGKPFTPPVLIVVCDNTQVSEVFFRKLSGEHEVETMDENGKTVLQTRYDGSAILPEFSNSEDFQHTIRIDSKLLAKIETEEGESKDTAALRLRELIDTVGKRGGSGEQVRCVVSVSMLTEGWDANNVTHVLGVRAFGSQLLCEQVVGRGLRRMSYVPDTKTGLLPAEYVDVYGIPFSLIPYKGKPKESAPDPVYHAIYSMPERAELEIRMPNVESFVYALKEGGIRCDVDTLEGFVVDKEPGEVYLAPTRGYQDDPSSRKDVGDFIKQTREEYYKTVRVQQIFFRLAQLIMEDLIQGAQAEQGERGKLKFLARHQLFPEIVKIVKEYVAKKVVFKPGVDERELGLERYAQLLRERVRDGILPAAARTDAKLLPILNSFQPYTSTANVNYQTTRPVIDLVKSHLNRAVIRSGWETKAIDTLEKLDCVECFTPNDRQIGLIVPYEYGGQRHNYEPDFMVKLQNKKIVMLEIKGAAGSIHDEDLVLAKNAAARKWVAAVNNLKTWGEWEFDICKDLQKLRGRLEQHAGTDGTARPFCFVTPTSETAWNSCVPLLTLQGAVSFASEKQPELSALMQWSEEWVTWQGAPTFDKGMFVARVRGKAMDPNIPDGAYCLFRPLPGKNRQGKTLLVGHAGISDPMTAGAYTVRIYESDVRESTAVNPQQVRVILKPKNPSFDPIVLEVKDEAEVKAIAECVSPLLDFSAQVGI